MKPISSAYMLLGAIVLAAVFFVVASSLEVQAQDPSIVGTWSIVDDVSDVVTSFYADGTMITVTEFSLTHPDTPQLGVWWQEGDGFYWTSKGFTIVDGVTTSITVTGTVQMNSNDEITVDPFVEITLPNGATVLDDGPPVTAARMLPQTGR